MQAIQFQTTLHNTIINLPSQYQNWSGKQVHVILLAEEESIATTRPVFDAISLKTRGFRFNREEANER